MRYCWTTLQVKNLDESIAFYRDIVGLPVMNRFFATKDTEIAFLGEGETQIELIDTSLASDPGSMITLGFATDDLNELMKQLKQKHIRIESGPIQPNEHIIFIYIRDPNGVRIQFSQTFEEK
jgi:lactoylglutathione lyase